MTNKENKVYEYFIVYEFEDRKGNTGTGNLSIATQEKITTIADIQELREEIKRKYKLQKMVILNCILMGKGNL